jgi:hypothetical protein
LPDPGTDVTQRFRDEDWFAATAEAVAGLGDPAVESVPACRGAGTTYFGIDGFREMWLEPWASYHVQVDEMFDLGDSVVVLVRDRARPHGMDVEVELIAGLPADLWQRKIVRVQFYANRQELRKAVGFES